MSTDFSATVAACDGCCCSSLPRACHERSRPQRRWPSFEERCAQPGVVKCVGFDSQEQTDRFIFPPYGLTVKRARVVADIKASGAGSLRFEIPSNTGADTSGSFWQNFADDLSVQFGEGEEFHVQWRGNDLPGSFWTRTTRAEADGSRPSSARAIGPGRPCTPAPSSKSWSRNTGPARRGRDVPQLAAEGRPYEPLEGHKVARPIQSDEWMTFQVYVRFGSGTRNIADITWDSNPAVGRRGRQPSRWWSTRRTTTSSTRSRRPGTARSGCSPTTAGRARRRTTPSATPGMTISSSRGPGFRSGSLIRDARSDLRLHGSSVIRK